LAAGRDLTAGLAVFSGSSAFSDHVTGGLAQAKRERTARVSRIGFFHDDHAVSFAYESGPDDLSTAPPLREKILFFLVLYIIAKKSSATAQIERPARPDPAEIPP
jgi:hypothetical protein